MPRKTDGEKKTRGEVERRVKERTAKLAKANENLQAEIAERKRLEQALSESEKRFRLILERANDAFVGMDGNGLITHWNSQAETVFGWPRQEAVGRSLADTIIPPEYRRLHK